MKNLMIEFKPPMKTSLFTDRIFNRRLLICILTGFSSGLPLYILINLFAAWFHSAGIDLKTIGLLTLIQLPYTWKFLWSPLCDRYSLGIGRRRSWMLLTQLGLLAILPIFGWLSPQDDLRLIIGLAVAVAFLSASQDIAIDAFRRELLHESEQGLGSVIHVNAYKLASLIPGSLSLVLADHVSWQVVYSVTALFMLPGIALSLCMSEPVTSVYAPKTLRAAIVEPFHEFFQRQGVKNALLILAFIFLYKLGDTMASALLTPFYLDLGFSKTEIGIVAKNAGLWASIAGGIFGGVWLVYIGLNRALWIFGLLQALVILGFAWLATTDHSLGSLALVIALESFGMGLGTAAFVAFVATTTHPVYAATQFALFTSLAATPRTLANALAGYFVEGGDISVFSVVLFHINALGWQHFYWLCFALALPGMLLLFYIAPWHKTAKGFAEEG
ncbi:MFS transporter [Methylovulum psychrotolerans]|uniref:MFS transporter n=2 Tax=Methylovulum psychrotolerans TaxID=1704499 RepID=A0A2S5CJ09_9GAMM|nr:MFS transporter [Methylovulum psychrotolerans]